MYRKFSAQYRRLRSRALLLTAVVGILTIVAGSIAAGQSQSSNALYLPSVVRQIAAVVYDFAADSNSTEVWSRVEALLDRHGLLATRQGATITIDTTSNGATSNVVQIRCIGLGCGMDSAGVVQASVANDIAPQNLRIGIPLDDSRMLVLRPTSRHQLDLDIMREGRLLNTLSFTCPVDQDCLIEITVGDLYSTKVVASSGTDATQKSVDIWIEVRSLQPGDALAATDVDVAYDPAVVRSTSCVADPDNAFDLSLCNVDMQGKAQLNAVSAAGITQPTVRLAKVTFLIVGQPGSTSPLTVLVSTFADPAGDTLPVQTQDGLIAVSPPPTDTPTPTPTNTPAPLPTPTATVVSTDRIVLSWSFDQDTGTTTHDSSGLGNDGIISGATRSEAGKFGPALSFDGVNDGVAIADDALNGKFPSKYSDSAQDFTISAWIKLDRLSRRNPIVSKMGDGTTGFFFIVEADNRLKLTVWKDPYQVKVGTVYVSGKYSVLSANRYLAVNTWYHVAAVYDFVSSGASRARLYVNGNVVGQSNTFVGPSMPNTVPLEAGRYVWRQESPNSNISYLDGLLDEVRIFSRALSEAEIKALSVPSR